MSRAQTETVNAALAFLAGGGEVGALMRSHDWNRSPLGAPAGWPSSLRTVVSLVINSKTPLFLSWGKNLCLLYNDAYLDILGQKHPAALGQPIQAVWPEIWNDIAPLIKRTLDGEAIYHQNQPFRIRRNGEDEQTWFTFSYSPVRDESGAVAGLYCALTETTAQVCAERHRLEETERLRRLLQEAPSMMAVVRGPDHVYELTNAAYLRLIGRQDIIGKPVRDVVPEFEAQGLIALLDQVYATGEPFIGRAVPVSVMLPTGQPKEHFIDFVYQPIVDGTGRVTGVFGEGIDVTETVRTTAALRASEERLRLLDTMSEATRAAVDPQAIMVETTRLLGEYLGVTRCAYADVEPDNDRFTIRHDWTTEGAISTVGVYSLDLFGSRAATDMRSGYTLILHDVDRELTASDGADMFNALGIKAIICCPLVKENRLVAMMAVHHDRPRTWSGEDVSLVEEVVERSWAHIERVRATEALRESDRRKTEFLATLAHELRNPLAPIQTGLDILRLATDNPATIDKVRAMMERQLTHMVHLVNDLLDVARITRGKVELKKERIDLHSAVSSAVEASLPLIEGGQHELTVTLPDPPLMLDADPTRIAQILSNLLNNAAKYTPSGGRITLTAHREDGQVVLAVSDTGIGIAPQGLPLIFEMFAQMEPAVGRAQGGLGIGLTLVRRLVELHGGTVTASSRGIGHGSTFVVRLPLAAASEAEPASPRVAPTASGREKFRVLVVDDNIDAANALATLLQMDGHTIQVAHDGPTALQIAPAFAPDLVFLDIGMPGMNGYDVAAALRREQELTRCMLVAVTGWGTQHDRARAQQAGFDQHLTKPASLADVERLLSVRTQQNQGAAQ